MPLRWGFSSAGRIAHDYMNAMGTINKGDHRVVAISDPDVSRAEELSKRFNIPKYYSSSLELANDPNVEIVHVGALNPLHYEVAKFMLEHGKHVLIEKPMCMNLKQVQKLIELAKKKNVLLMEGLWPRFFPSYHYIRKQIDNGAFGEVLSVEVEMGNVAMSGCERIMKKSFGGGITLDCGVYTIQFCQWIFQEKPKSIRAKGILNEEGVDIEVETELSYSNNKVAIMKTSTINTYTNTAIIRGTKGIMTIPYFWSPTSLIDVDGKEKTFEPLPDGQFEFVYDRSCGLRYEPDAVRNSIRAGKKECDFATLNDSVTIAYIQDEIRRQIGVKYPADDEDY